MFLPLQAVELDAFYMWLRGRLTPKQPDDDLALVFVLCPDMRKKLIIEFCESLHADARVKAFYQYFNRLERSSCR